MERAQIANRTFGTYVLALRLKYLQQLSRDRLKREVCFTLIRSHSECTISGLSETLRPVGVHYVEYVILNQSISSFILSKSNSLLLDRNSLM